MNVNLAQGISGFGADVDEDYAWLSKNTFANNPGVFPADKFGPEDFRWAVGVALSRSFFVNGELRLTPLVDFANHASLRGVFEPTGGYDARAEVLLASRAVYVVAVRCMYPLYDIHRIYLQLSCLVPALLTMIFRRARLDAPLSLDISSRCSLCAPSWHDFCSFSFACSKKAEQRACSGRRPWC